VLSYGGNFRRNTFDISLAPNGDNRSEGGGYLQDEIFLNNYFRWVVGAALTSSRRSKMPRSHRARPSS
jgi:hypothetical protein